MHDMYVRQPKLHGDGHELLYHSLKSVTIWPYFLTTVVVPNFENITSREFPEMLILSTDCVDNIFHCQGENHNVIELSLFILKAV